MEVFTSFALLGRATSTISQLLVYIMIIYNLGACGVSCMAYSAFNKKY